MGKNAWTIQEMAGTQICVAEILTAYEKVTETELKGSLDWKYKHMLGNSLKW